MFVVHGDITAIACDLWLLPASGHPHWAYQPGWLHHVPKEQKHRRFEGTPVEGCGNRVCRLDSFPCDEYAEPLLVHVSVPEYLDDSGIDPSLFYETPASGGLKKAERTRLQEQIAAWLADGVRAFLRVASVLLEGAKPRNRRERPLVALPVVGTGAGGGWSLTGAVIKALLEVLLEAAQDASFDTLLVCRDGASSTLAQRLRLEASGRFWPSPRLTPSLEAHAARLAAAAARGQLVLFLGAGVSAGAGLPTWHSLLDAIYADEAGGPAADGAQPPFGALDALDKAERILGLLQHDRQRLGEAVARRLNPTYVSLVHVQLAALPVKQFVTTNYDRLFERAHHAWSQESVVPGAMDPTHTRLSVIPYAPLQDHARWLLKMHGCVSAPADIVLTRADYAAYEGSKQAALAGIVQAQLMTSHMLFVGFSMVDPNYQRILRSVVEALGIAPAAAPTSTATDAATAAATIGSTSADASTRGLLGTTLQLLRAASAQQQDSLWDGHGTQEVVTMEPEPPPPEGEKGFGTVAGAARRLEIFLDLTLARATAHGSTRFLLDSRFKSSLAPADLEVSQALLRLHEGLSKEALETDGGRELVGLMRAMGWRQHWGSGTGDTPQSARSKPGWLARVFGS